MLDESVIQQHLSCAGFSKPVHIHVLQSIDSTNRFLKELPFHHAIDVCCAETQTQGRGRFGRSWHSPRQDNIYFSIRLQFNCCLSELSGLSLIVSMAVLAALKVIGITEDVRIKWPNDLLWQGKKLCGSLIEVAGDHHDRAEVVIGIGLNVNALPHENTPIDKPWCSLYEITGTCFNRNTLIANLIMQLDSHMQQFINKGFSSFIPAWQQADYLYGKQITVSQTAGQLSGTANGINEAGQLILIDAMGVTHYLSSGDTSLRS